MVGVQGRRVGAGMFVGGVLSMLACVVLALMSARADNGSLEGLAPVFAVATVVAAVYAWVGVHLRNNGTRARVWATTLLILGLIPAFLVPVFFGNIVLLVMLVADASAEQTAVLLD